MPARGELSPSRLWFVTLRLLEVSAVALLLATGIQLWTSWESTGDYDPFGAMPTGATDVPFMSRVTSVVFFNDLRPTFVSLVVVAAVVALGAGVLLRIPVANGRLLRWELLALWGAAMAVVVVVVGFHVLALFGQDPYSPQGDTPTIPPDAGYRPTMLVQLVGGVAWPVAGALSLAASGLWWLRVPSDLESAHEDERAELEEEPGGPEPGGPDRGGPEPGGQAVPGSGRAVPTARERRRADRDDALLLDGVEQIEPVDRLTPREAGRDDDGTSSGYEGYLRSS
jgi:hypothetical protein